MKSILLATLLVLAGFVGGVAMPQRAAPPPEIAIADSPELLNMPAPADRACKNALDNIKAQIAMCLALPAAPESSASTPPRSPTEEMDDYTAKLIETHTTNTEVVFVRWEGRTYPYGPGTWPPPDGPPIGSRVIAQKDFGGMEYDPDSGTWHTALHRRVFCPCPRDPVDGGTEGVP